MRQIRSAFAIAVILLAIILAASALAITPPVTLTDAMIGPVGSRALFKATLFAAMDGYDTTGPLAAFVGTGDTLERVVMVEYTVLPVDRLTRRPRLEMRAWPLNPQTGAKLPGHSWQVTYGIHDNRPVRLGGDDVPADYTFLVEPSWLVNWALSSQNDLPAEPTYPGTQWTATGKLPAFGPYQFQGELAVTGTFVDWLAMDNSAPVAHIAETGIGTGALPIPALAAFGTFTSPRVTVEQHYYVVPGQFPLRVEKGGSADVRVNLRGVPGLRSAMDFVVHFFVVYERDLNGSQ